MPTRISRLTTARPQPCAAASALSGTRTHNHQHLMLALLPKLGHERVEPLPGADPGHRRTKAEPQPCAAAKLPGLESNQCEPRFRALVGCQQPARYRVRGAGVESATTTF